MAYFRELDLSKDYEDIKSLDLREIDKKEGRAYVGENPIVALLLSIRKSEEVYVIIHKERIVGVFGVIHAYDHGVPWMVATEELKDFYREFYKVSLKVVEGFKQDYKSLMNYVGAENEVSIRWLEHIGFTIDKSKEYIFYDKDFPFYKFTM